MTLPAALPEDPDLGDLLTGLFRRLRETWPGCADPTEALSLYDEAELARRILAAVADPSSAAGLDPDPAYAAETTVSTLLAADDPDELLDHNPRVENPLVARLLIRRARAHTSTGSRHAVRIATFAVRASERINRYTWGHDYVRTTRLQARCTRVDALRAARRLDDAQEEAAQLLESLDPALPPRLRGDLRLLAGQVRRDRGEHAEAAALLFAARDIYEAASDGPRLGRALLLLADVYREHGQTDLAVDAARRAASLLDPETDRAAHASARHNLAIYLCDTGRPVEARAELEASRRVRGVATGRGERLRSLWIEARIHEQLGDAATAERLYREAQEGLLAACLPLDAGRAGLDLAWLLVEDGRHAEAFEVSTWLGILFRRHEAPPAALTALLAFREAAQADSVEAEDLLDCLAILRAVLRRASFD